MAGHGGVFEAVAVKDLGLPLVFDEVFLGVSRRS